jgi:hypothetical protein
MTTLSRKVDSTVGRMISHTTDAKVRLAAAPSTCAASTSSSGTPSNAANTGNVTNASIARCR